MYCIIKKKKNDKFTQITLIEQYINNVVKLSLSFWWSSFKLNKLTLTYICVYLYMLDYSTVSFSAFETTLEINDLKKWFGYINYTILLVI